MDSTPVSLLERIRSGPSEQEWHRFVELYAPLLTFWARRLGLQDSDAADLVQEIFVVLVRELPQFIYQPGKRFRGWLWTITVNKWRERKRKYARQSNLVEETTWDQMSTPDNTVALDEQEYNRYLVSRALQLMQSRFQPTTWRACWESVVAGRPTAEIANELGISPNAVRLAKSHVLRELRRELDGLLE
jgi:RNA polymerase sigma-70 factor (ECF subfamily)